VRLATTPTGRDVEWRCVEGRRGGPGVGERGVGGRSWFRRSWPASDRGDGRLSREPAERAGVAPGPPAPGLCPGGPDDRSATGRRGWGPRLVASLAGGVFSHPAATRPGSPAGQRAQQVASSLCADPVGALVPFEPSDPVGAFGPLSAPHDNRFPETVGRRRGIVGPLGRRTLVGDVSRPAGPGWGNGWPFGPTRWWAVCGGGPGGRFLPALMVFTRAFWHPCRVLAMCVGRGPGVFAALDPRLISETPTGVGCAGIGRSRRHRALGARNGGCERGGLRRLRRLTPIGGSVHKPLIFVCSAGCDVG